MLTPTGSVLIAEDDDTVRRLLIEYLKKHAYVTVEGVRDGVEALHHLSQSRYSVVILDLMMPKMSGTDVIDSLKAHMFDPSVKDLANLPAVVIITSMSDQEVSNDVLVQRCPLIRGVFRKPLDITRLGECVEHLLHEKRAESRAP